MRLFTYILVVVVLVVGRMCLFTVDHTEFVYVTQLGRHVATYDGGSDDQAGLHFRLPWPIQSLTTIDRRLQVLELPSAEQVTEDPSQMGSIDKTLAVDAYVVWRIPDAAACEQFIVTIGTMERAQEILRDRFRNRLGAVIAHTRFDDLISTELGSVEMRPALAATTLAALSSPLGKGGLLAAAALIPQRTHVDEKREELRQQFLAAPSQRAEDGIEIVDVRIRRLNYPAQVRQEIFQRIISERNRKATIYQSRGQTEAENIRSGSKARISIAEAEARARNVEKRGRADSEADRILNQAISKDPEYYAELKKRELGEAALDTKKKVWSTSLFKLFFPSLPGEGMKPAKEGGK